MAWQEKTAGTEVKAEDINEIHDALSGVAGKAQTVAITEVDEAGVFALDVRNKDTISSRIARFRNGLSETVVEILKSAVNVGKQIVSSVPDGTPPLVVASTTRVANLNADAVDGYDAPLPTAALADDAVDSDKLLDAEKLGFVGALVYSDATQLVIDDEITPLAFTTEVYDEGDLWDAADPTKFVAVEEGWYQAGGSIYIMFTNKTKAGAWGISVQVNGETFYTWSACYMPATISTNVACCSPAFKLMPGDYVQIMVRNSTGESQRISAASAENLHSFSGWIKRVNDWPGPVVES